MTRSIIDRLAGVLRRLVRPASRGDRALVGPQFDPEFYLHSYPDVAEAGMDPLDHYLRYGWRDGRRPNTWFDPQVWLRARPDLVVSGGHPFVHYLREQGTAGAIGARYERLRDLPDDPAMTARIAEARALDPAVALPDVPRGIVTQLTTLGPLLSVTERMRRTLSGADCPVVLVVGNDAGGEDRTLATALGEIAGSARVLVLWTDGREHLPAMDSDGMRQAAMPAGIDMLPAPHQAQALIDVLRGVGCRIILQCGSGLCWRALKLYGRQLGQDFTIVTCLTGTAGNDAQIDRLHASAGGPRVVLARSAAQARAAADVDGVAQVAQIPAEPTAAAVLPILRDVIEPVLALHDN
ncbi:hypothetical protein [Pukyongiella litopenaei]|uniref:Uncharacterized protein n=1 Tax=Pukyongiella litopenaei TaxID=2605946 RepID=A0A2S0MTJ1_9RHOB|nr:hypothetical protein [Pukyongiella litopenaei]AVO39209.1 hypothetical protein C6Y53_16820 [Pukyongiella litopenaei]